MLTRRSFISKGALAAADYIIYQVMEIQKRGIRWASMSKYEPMGNWVKPVYN